MILYCSRDEFYQDLWEDYVEHSDGDVFNCFYYKYIKRKKDVKAELIAHSKHQITDYFSEKRPDKYILIHGAYLAYKRNGVLDKKEYKDIFIDMVGSQKGYKKIIDLLDTNIDEANEKYERELLTGCVRDFFVNEGFKAKGEVSRTQNKHRKEKYGYNDIIEMMNNYLYSYKNEEQAEDQPSGTGEVTEDYIEKCAVLYEILLQDNQTDAFVPLKFDTDSGAGIFIIGKNNFDEDIGKACAVCILYFSELYPDSVVIQNQLEIVMMVETFDTVHEAFDSFKKDIINEMYLENYCELNISEDGEYFFDEKIDKCFKSRMVNRYEMSAREKKIISDQAKKEAKKIADLKRMGIVY